MVQTEARTLAIRRSKYDGHLKNGWDTTLLAKSLAVCYSNTKGAMTSLTTGDAYTDSTARTFGKGMATARSAVNQMRKCGIRCGTAQGQKEIGRHYGPKSWERKG